MSAARPAPRRIVPQLVAPSQAVRPAAAAAAFGEAHDVSQSASQPAQQLDLREQADIAAKKLGPGRRIFVDLEKNGNVVDWHKVTPPFRRHAAHISMHLKLRILHAR